MLQYSTRAYDLALLTWAWLPDHRYQDEWEGMKETGFPIPMRWVLIKVQK